MAAFKYTAMDHNGKETTGIVNADSVKHVSSILREQNLIPIDIDFSQGEASSKAEVFSLSNSLSKISFFLG